MTKLGGRYLFRANRFTPSLNNHQAFDLPKKKKKKFSLFLSCTDFTKKKKNCTGKLFFRIPSPHEKPTLYN